MLAKAFFKYKTVYGTATQRCFGSSVAPSRMPTEKNYYSILGVSTSATPEQIKEAYRLMVKMHHPDVQGSAQPDAGKFRDIMEAFSVLSVRESRANYDLQRRRNPLAFQEQSEVEFNKSHRNDLRDAAGNTPIPRPTPGSYAEERMAELAAQRKEFNVNHLGYYRGGVPQKGRGVIRGDALGPPGNFHLPQVHNFLRNHTQDNQLIDSEDAVKFKRYMNDDRTDFQRLQPGYPMYYDREMLFRKDRHFWLTMIITLLGGMYAVKKYSVEVNRAHRTARLRDLEDMPAHHFNNRGGVLLKK